MIQFDEVTKEYSGETIFEGVSFKLNRGEKCGLVGRNGSGKTTLLRLITGEERPDKGVVAIPKHYTIGYLSQHLHFTEKSVLEEAATALGENADIELHKAEKMLFGLGFKEEDLDTPLEKFSGGYQLRVHLAKVLLKEPNCLLLDEPTNYLDIVSIRYFTKFLHNWQGELIVISHDRQFMDSVTTHTLGLHRKKIRKLEGGTVEFYTQLLEEEQIYEKTRLNMDKKKQKMESFITRFGAKATKAKQAQSKAKMLARMPVLEELASLHNLDFTFPYAPFPGKKFLQASDVSFKYEEAQDLIIKDFSLTIDATDRIAIVGKNGRGKSTILKLLAQEVKPQKGLIDVSSNVRVGFFGQTNIDRLHQDLTIEEEILESAPHLSRTEIRKICGTMMFSGDTAKKPIKVLSGGEKSRVLLGKLLVSPSNLLLLDEPTNHLDMESIEALMQAVDAFEGAVVIVTHSELLLREIPSKFVICHEGEQHLFLGEYDLFLEKEGWEKKAASKPKIKAPHPKNPKVFEKIEKQITELEKANEEATKALMEASDRGETEKVIALSKEIEERKHKIEKLFFEL